VSGKQNRPILQVRDLKTWFASGRGWFSRGRFVRAVDGVSLSVRRGSTLGLVGESGSGKTTVGQTVMRLIPATAGSVIFDGQDVFSLPRPRMRALRRRITMIFQDPFGSLNPRMTVERIVSEPLRVHRIVPRRHRRDRVEELLARVGLSGSYANRYPHEFSGGQRQRIGIARALASQPDFVICDEPVSALDVSIQAQILNLLSDLQAELGLSYLFIAHNLAVVEQFADEVAVMYLGRIVEHAPRDALYRNPIHPYTVSLLSSVPRLAPGQARTRRGLTGEMPSPVSPPTGCPFHPRCPLTRRLAAELGERETVAITSAGQRVRIVKRCTRDVPQLEPVSEGSGHLHACLLKRS